MHQFIQSDHEIITRKGITGKTHFLYVDSICRWLIIENAGIFEIV